MVPHSCALLLSSALSSCDSRIHIVGTLFALDHIAFTARFAMSADFSGGGVDIWMAAARECHGEEYTWCGPMRGRTWVRAVGARRAWCVDGLKRCASGRRETQGNQGDRSKTRLSIRMHGNTTKRNYALCSRSLGAKPWKTLRQLKDIVRIAVVTRLHGPPAIQPIL